MKNLLTLLCSWFLSVFLSFRTTLSHFLSARSYFDPAVASIFSASFVTRTCTEDNVPDWKRLSGFNFAANSLSFPILSNCLFTTCFPASEPICQCCCQHFLFCSLSRRTDSVRRSCYQFGLLSEFTFTGLFFRVSSLSGLSCSCSLFRTRICFNPAVANIFIANSCP